MEGTGAGWDSCLYRIFIVGGILFIVAATVVTALTQPAGSQMPVYVGVGSAVGFLVLTVGYWALQIFVKGYGAPKAIDLTQKEDVKNLSVLQSWDTLFAAMSTNGGDPEKMKALEKQGGSALKIWFAWAAVIALCPMALMLPYAFGLVEWSVIKYGAMCYIGLALIMTVVSVVLGSRSAKIGDELYFAPLGLQLTTLPQVDVIGTGPRVSGATVINGIRYDRSVRISIGLSKIETQVASSAPRFVIKSVGGDLQADADAPKVVKDVLRSLRKAKRWEGLQVICDGESVVATRNSRGKNMWLYDLWLIERILEKMFNNEINT